MSRVELTGIRKTFGAVEIITDLNLTIEDGEFVVIVGPSGCGKSTLLRLIAGLEPITDGEFRIDGNRANETPPQKRNIAMVFQSYALFPHMSVRQNIEFGPRIRGEKRANFESRVLQAAEILNLSALLDRRPGELSGGQRQRVAMGRSIVRNPSVFLFDEPLSNLDAHLRVEMRTEIVALQRKLGTTTVYVTHDQLEAMTMADRIVIMNGGKIAQAGPPLELYDHPVNRFVACFLGSPQMTIFTGRHSRLENGSAIITDDGLSLTIPELDLPNGQVLDIGIRPESFELGNPAQDIPMMIEVVEPTGSETQVFGYAGRTKVCWVSRGRPGLRAGDRIGLKVETGHMHVFDNKSGIRL